MTCTQDDFLAAVQAGEGSGVIDLNGNCTYVLTSASDDWNGGSGAFIFRAKELNGNGAILERAASAPRFRLLGVQVDGGITIRDLTLRNGDVSKRGGGLLSLRPVTLLNVRFEGNHADDLGGALVTQDQTVIRNSTFTQNQSDKSGGALYGFSDVTIEDSRFTDNRGVKGGALRLQGGENVVLDSLFVSNDATGDYGSAIYSSGHLTLLNNTITDHAANTGHAILVWGQTSLYNNIIANHYVGLAAGGGTDNTVTEDYNVFAGNTRNDLMYNQTPLNRGNNTVQAQEIRFVAPGNNDYSLSPNSIGVDMGSSTYLNQYASLQTDLAGNPRPFGNSSVDVGAFETQASAVASVSIQKSGPPWVAPNDPFVFALTVSNPGKLPAANLMVTETLPAGALYVDGSASDGGSYNNRTLTWNIGALQPGQTKRLEYRVTTSQDLTSDAYRVYSTSDALVEDSGPTLETPLNTNIVAALGFFPNPNGFGFYNWGKPSEPSDLTTEDMVLLFGNGVCTTGSNPCVLTPGAQAWRDKWLGIAEGGHCYGMAVASLRSFMDLPFKGMTQPGDFQPGANTIFDLNKSEITRNYITHYFVTQGTTPVNTQGVEHYATNGTPRDFLDVLRANLQDPNATDRYIVGFWKRDRSGGHAVTPYAVEDRGGGVFWVHVYDNNYPNDFNRRFKIDLNADTWVYEGAAINPSAPPSTYEGDAQTHSLYLLSTTWSSNTPKQCSFCTSSLRAAGAEPSIQFSMNGEARILVTDGQGRRIGYDPITGEYINEIEGAEQNPPLLGLGLKTPPLLNLPDSNGYNVQVFNVDNGLSPSESVADLYLSAPGFAANVDNLMLSGTPILPDVGPNTKSNHIRTGLAAGYDMRNVAFNPIERRMTYQNSGTNENTPALSINVTNPDGSGVSVTLNNLQLEQKHSAALYYNATNGTVAIENNDSRDNSYAVEVVRTNPDGSKNNFQSTVSDGSGVGVVLNVGDSWDGASEPQIDTLTTPTLPQINTEIYLPSVNK